MITTTFGPISAEKFEVAKFESYFVLSSLLCNIVRLCSIKVSEYVAHSEILSFIFQTDIQAPLNRQIVRSSETIMYFVDLMDNMLTTFMGPQDNNDLGKTDNRPRSYLNNNLGYLGEVLNFARTLYNLTK